MDADAIAELFARSMRSLDDDEETACQRALAVMLPAYWTANSDFSRDRGGRADKASRDARGKFDRRWGRWIDNMPLREGLRACLGLRKAELDALIKLIDPPGTQSTQKAS